MALTGGLWPSELHEGRFGLTDRNSVSRQPGRLWQDASGLRCADRRSAAARCEVRGNVVAEHPNAGLIREAISLFNRRDWDAYREYFTDDVVWHVGGDHPLSGDYRGRDAMLSCTLPGTMP